MPRPLIGLCASLEIARYGAWEELCDLLPRMYSTAVQEAGGLAVILPPDDDVARDPGELLGRLDALVLAGGGDIDPASYGARPHAETKNTREDRDRFELALAHRALERDVPLLGVCRGMQMLNVASGGTLIQHVPDALGSDSHLHTPGAFGDHEVELEPGSLAARAVGSGTTTVKSHHHQGVDELGEGLRATGHAAGDGLVEAIELPDRAFALGVLWHPEADEASRVIAALVEQAGG
ncbi:MAG: gamma-glutamyl-gamma-aminobutyrate hydrolase family protein [Thermoleophilaceae bacterium]